MPAEPVHYSQRPVIRAGTQTTSENALAETGMQTTSEDVTVETETQTASEDTVAAIGTQLTTTVVEKKQWTRRSTGPYHRLAREEEEEEGFDQEAGPSAKKWEAGVREIRQEVETTWPLTALSELGEKRKDDSRQPGERIAASLL